MKRSYHRQFIYVLFLLLSFIGAVGCTSMGYTDVDTTRKAILVANAEVRAGNLLLQDLVERQAIGKSDADKALKALQDAKNHLQTALSAVDAAGDPVLAGSNLDRAKVALNIAVTLLAPLVET
jgi:stage V sporulation protein SpoVS